MEKIRFRDKNPASATLGECSGEMYVCAQSFGSGFSSVLPCINVFTPANRSLFRLLCYYKVYSGTGIGVCVLRYSLCQCCDTVTIFYGSGSDF
jgi:hypothetical protein